MRWLKRFGIVGFPSFNAQRARDFGNGGATAGKQTAGVTLTARNLRSTDDYIERLKKAPICTQMGDALGRNENAYTASRQDLLAFLNRAWAPESIRGATASESERQEP